MRRVRQSDDRFSTAVFLAALLHVMLIMGIRFSAPAPEDRPLPTLEVLLVPDGPQEEADPRAGYIAERSQRGFGTGRDFKRTSLPEATASLLQNQGASSGDPFDPELATEAVGDVQVLASLTMDATRSHEGADLERTESLTMPMEARPLPQVGVNALAADEQLRLRGEAVIADSLVADTRESAIAAYLDSSKRRIERVGTINFPDEARRRSLSGNPVLEVVIDADGTLQDVIIRRSSGHRELDRAAIRIVRLSSPFDPFPTAMRERYPNFRFAYEWRFLEGRSAGSTAWAGER